MDLDDYRKSTQSEEGGWKNFFINYIRNPLLFGFMFGVGHFLAFLLLEQEYFKILRPFAKKKALTQ
jgi:hypothetical protein